MSKVYPLYSSSALSFVCGALQCAVWAFCRKRDWAMWRLGWNIRLLAVIYLVIGFLFSKHFPIDIFNINNIPVLKNKINLICFFINHIHAILINKC